MSKFSLDLSKFKKVKSDEKSSVLKHEDGHELKIDHKKLPKALKSKLDKLSMDDKKAEPVQKFYSAGMVEENPSETPPEAQADMAPQPEAVPMFGGQPEPKNFIDTAMAEYKEPAPAPVQPQVPQNTDPFGMEAFKQSQLGGMELQQQGELGKLRAQGAAGAAEAKAEQEHIKNLTNAQTNYDATMQDLLKQDALYQQDLANGHIDPNKHVNEMSTGSRIATGIGLILGGMGAGLTGGPNMAFQYLQNQIDRDIDSQKADLGKKQSLLSHNMALMGNARAGEELTRLQLNDIVNSKIRMEAAKSQGPMAKAAQQNIEGLFQQKKGEFMHNIAIQQAQFGGVSGGPDPAKMVPMLVPKEHQAKAFSEIEAAENTRKMSGSIMDAFEKAAKENTVLRTGAGLLRTPGAVGALHQAMQPTFKDLEGTVRQAAMDNTFSNITPSPGDTQYKIDTKREALQEYLKSKLSAPTARAYGIDLGKFQSTAPAPDRNPNEGKTATGPNGQRVIMQNGQWVPYSAK